MLARLDPRFLDRLWFPLGEQSKDETRAEAERAGLEAAAPRREPGGLLPRRRRLPRLPRAPRSRPGGRPDRRRGGQASSAATPASGASRPGQRKRPRGRRRRAALRAAQRAADEHGRRRPALGARHRRGRRRAAASTSSVERAEVKLRYRSPAVGAGVARRPTAAFACDLDDPPTASPPGQAAVLYERDAVVGAGTIANLPKPSRPSRVCTERANDRRRDHAHHPARAAVPRGRAPRARRRRRAAEPDASRASTTSRRRSRRCSSAHRSTAR